MRRLAIMIALLAVLPASGCGLVPGAGDEPADGPPAARWEGPASAPAGAAAPTVGRNAVLRPVFDTTEGEIGAGTAFVLGRDDGTYVLVTAHHLFGPNGGMSRDIRADELTSVVRGVTATSADDSSVKLTSRRVVEIAGASAFIPSDGNTPTDVRPDIAAFRLDGPGGATVLALAAEPAEKGDRVYLLAEVSGSDARLHPATVDGTGRTAVSYAFDESLELRGSSGAPMLNARGEVIGINAAGGENGGETFGLCGPLDAVREKLAGALGG
jgi:hypothetical protein